MHQKHRIQRQNQTKTKHSQNRTLTQRTDLEQNKPNYTRTLTKETETETQGYIHLPDNGKHLGRLGNRNKTSGQG